MSARALALAALALTALLAPPPAAAELCSVDLAPAATVLLPYFEVALGDASGTTTLFELSNASPRSVVVRVTLWTDLAIPTFAFDLWLTGYDVQSFNLRDLFAGGLPATGPGTSPNGYFSLPGGPFVGCPGALATAVPAAHLRAAHSGLGSALHGGLCSGRDLGDGHARGYLTADVVGRCGSGLFPSDPGYFGADGIARHDNVLWGHYYYVEAGRDFAQGESLVRLEADPAAFGPGDRTFYGRYVGDSGIDGREPLPGSWVSRYLTGGPFDAGTRLVTWRETPGAPIPFACGSAPPWYPLPLTQVVSFDEEENAVDAREIIFIQPPPPTAPAAAQSDGDYLVVHPFGWVFADLDRSPLEPAQAYVAALIGAEGRYSVGTAATPFGAGCGPAGCGLGREAEAARLCLEPVNGADPTLDPGERARVRATAAGCYNNCNFVHQAACTVRPAGTAGGLEVATRFCINPPAPGCLGPPVCDPVEAVCLTAPLAAGDYALGAGDLELRFSVPTALPPGGLCVGGL